MFVCRFSFLHKRHVVAVKEHRANQYYSHLLLKRGWKNWCNSQAAKSKRREEDSFRTSLLLLLRKKNVMLTMYRIAQAQRHDRMVESLIQQNKVQKLVQGLWTTWKQHMAQRTQLYHSIEYIKQYRQQKAIRQWRNHTTVKQCQYESFYISFQFCLKRIKRDVWKQWFAAIRYRQLQKVALTVMEKVLLKQEVIRKLRRWKEFMVEGQYFDKYQATMMQKQKVSCCLCSLLLLWFDVH